METLIEKKIENESFWDRLKKEKKESLVKEKVIERDKFKQEIENKAKLIHDRLEVIEYSSFDPNVRADASAMNKLREEKSQLCNELYNLYANADARSIDLDMDFSNELMESAEMRIQAQRELDGFYPEETTEIVVKAKEVVKEIEKSPVKENEKVIEIQNKLVNVLYELEHDTSLTLERTQTLLIQLAKILLELLKAYNQIASRG